MTEMIFLYAVCDLFAGMLAVSKQLEKIEKAKKGSDEHELLQATYPSILEALRAAATQAPPYLADEILEAIKGNRTAASVSP